MWLPRQTSGVIRHSGTGSVNSLGILSQQFVIREEQQFREDFRPTRPIQGDPIDAIEGGSSREDLVISVLPNDLCYRVCDWRLFDCQSNCGSLFRSGTLSHFRCGQDCAENDVRCRVGCGALQS